EFNEPLNTVAAATGVQVLANGTAVQGGIALSDSNRRITFTPSAAFPANSTVTVTVQPSIADLADRLIDNPGTFTFQTGTATDTTRPSVVTLSPVNGAAGVPVNSVVEVQFSERIDPLTVIASDFTVTPTSGLQIPGTIVVSSDGQSATFTPSAALQAGTTYTATVSSSITDLTGQALIGNSTTFTTGVGSQGAGPSVVAVSPANNSTGVQANAKVMVQLNEPVEPLSVGSNAIVVSAGGTPVTGTISLSTDRTVLTFTPSSLLAVSTAYTVTVSGFEDVSGNAVALFSSSFTTGTSGVADTTPLTVSSFSPANGLTGVPVNTTIVLTFNKPVNPTTVNTSTVPVFASGFGGELAGSYSVSGNVVTFTPLTVLPANTRITVEAINPLQDVAGNLVSGVSSAFTTGTGADTVAPQVISVTPVDG